MFTQYHLKNNARVILVPQKDTKSLTTQIMFPVGSRYEPEKLSGVSHYIEHLMFKGTAKRKNTLTLTREIDRLGAEYNAFTGKEYTGYYIKADAQFANISFDILSDMLFNSKFDPKEMEREKGPIIEELRMYRDNPLMNIENLFEDLMYAGCPLGRDIGGTPKHVQSFKRDEVLAFRDKYYDISNLTLVVAGAVDDKTKELIERYFGGHEKKITASKTFKPACFGSTAKTKRLVVEQKKTDQAQLMLGFPGFPYGHANNPAVGVMMTIFGGSMSSRLFIKIRERNGLAYMVRAGSEHYRDSGHLFIRAGLEAKNINKAMKLIKEEVEKLKTKGVTARELADAKTHIRGGMTLSMEDSSAQANWYATQALFHDTIDTPEDKLKKIEAVTLAQIQKMANQLFKWGEMRCAIIGDVEGKRIAFSD